MFKRLALFLLCLSGPVHAQDVLVFAAASLKEPLDKIAAGFGGVTVSYGSSGALARQVGLGAPADIFLSANVDWIEVLDKDGAVVTDTIRDFASNALVIVGQPGMDAIDLTVAGLTEALAGGRFAMGETQSVPAGIYGREALTTLGLWDALQPQLAEVDNVRAALALVTRGEAPLGLVYQSDALVAPELPIVARIPAATHAPIRFVGAVTAQSTNLRALAFWDMIRSPAGQAVLAEAGFCTAQSAC